MEADKTTDMEFDFYVSAQMLEDRAYDAAIKSFPPKLQRTLFKEMEITDVTRRGEPLKSCYDDCRYVGSGKASDLSTKDFDIEKIRQEQGIGESDIAYNIADFVANKRTRTLTSGNHESIQYEPIENPEPSCDRKMQHNWDYYYSPKMARALLINDGPTMIHPSPFPDRPSTYTQHPKMIHDHDGVPFTAKVPAGHAHKMKWDDLEKVATGPARLENHRVATDIEIAAAHATQEEIDLKEVGSALKAGEGIGYDFSSLQSQNVEDYFDKSEEREEIVSAMHGSPSPAASEPKLR